MCVPQAALAIGAAVVSQAVSTFATVQSAKSQTKAIKHQLAVRQTEIDHAATAEMNDRLRAARREQGRIAVAAGESGLSLSSPSVEALILDSDMQAELSNDRSLANRESRRAAAGAEAQAAIPSRPSMLGAGLQIASAAARAYASGEARSARPRPVRGDGST
jgi:hypothetical protein